MKPTPAGPASLGVPALDRLWGPIPAGSKLLLRNDPGVEAEIFLYQAANASLLEGRPVVYVVNTRSPSSVRAAMIQHGLAQGLDEGELIFVDAFSAMLGTSEQAPYAVGDPTDPAELVATIERAARDNPGSVLLFDSLSALLDHAPAAAVEQTARALHDVLGSFVLSASLFTQWPYGDIPKELLAGFDAEVRIGGVEDRVLFGQYFRVERVAWRQDLEPKRHLFKVVRPGGVYVYIPKIVVTGPYNAGKSTFVQTCSDTAVSVDRLGTTVALDHGHVTIEGITADIFGTPGQARFDPILRTVASQALGVIIVVDATKPASFDRAHELMAKTWDQGLPAIVAANKQDLPNALSPDEVAKHLGVPAHVRVVGCNATDPASSRAVLNQMAESILAGAVIA